MWCFGLGCIVNQGMTSFTTLFLSSGSAEMDFVSGILPVIYLKADVSLTSAGTTNNVTTWNID